MARILDDRGIALDDWHPLDGSPAPEYIPPTWDAPHVGKRLIEAMQVLAKMPVARGPREFGNAWPSYYYEWEDLLAQQEQEEEEKKREERAQNRTRVLPSATEIMHMEAAICWPARYVGQFPHLVRVCGVVALAKSRHRDMRYAARSLRMAEWVTRRLNYAALDVIAKGLRRDAVPIF